MNRVAASLEGRYAVEREIGAGGMATVYLARDLRHDRKVALKVLRPELAAVVGAERFLAEIKTTANLQHPHVLPLHDSGEAEGSVFYVMPFVEGESLRERLRRERQLPVEQAVRIACEVAEALDYAHRHGTVHRDIKPENILLHEGRALVADFGIALALSRSEGATRLTETGMSLGTPHYMSPEQAMGEREVGPRSDVYSLACVLYEMLVGEPPFTGPSAQAIVGRVLTEEPRGVAAQRKSVPLHVDAAIRTGLAKLPADRFGTAAAFGEALRRPEVDSLAVDGGRSTSRSIARYRPLLYGTAGAVALSAIALLRQPALAGPSVYDVGLPDEAPLARDRISVSPAGDFLVYTAAADGDAQLWIRSLRDDRARALPGTEGARAPAISPDGRRIAFLDGGRLKVIPVEGGTVREVGQLIAISDGPQWASDEEILLADGDRVVLRWFDVDAGATRALNLPIANRCGLARPFLGGTRVVCTSTNLYARVIDVADGSGRFITMRGGDGGGLLRGSNFTVIEDRYLVFVSVGGELRAAAFDPATSTAGRPVTLVPRVWRGSVYGRGQFDIGADGTLVYAGGENSQIGSLVRSAGGEPHDMGLDPAAFLRFDLTPDGSRLAAVVEGEEAQELRVIDTRTGQSRVWARAFEVFEPIWTADGERILTTVRQPLPNGQLQSAVLWGRSDSPVPPDTLPLPAFAPRSLLPDGRILGALGVLLAVLDLSATPPRLDTLPIPDAWFAKVSPDGAWLAYQPNDLSRVVLSPFPSLDRDYQVTRGGDDPQWLSATDLVWLDISGRRVNSTNAGDFHRATVDGRMSPPVGPARFWFSPVRMTSTSGETYMVRPGDTVVYVEPPDPSVGTYLRVVPDWVEQMKRAVREANRQ